MPVVSPSGLSVSIGIMLAMSFCLYGFLNYKFMRVHHYSKLLLGPQSLHLLASLLTTAVQGPFQQAQDHLDLHVARCCTMAASHPRAVVHR